MKKRKKMIIKAEYFDKKIELPPSEIIGFKVIL